MSCGSGFSLVRKLASASRHEPKSENAWVLYSSNFCRFDFGNSMFSRWSSKFVVEEPGCFLVILLVCVAESSVGKFLFCLCCKTFHSILERGWFHSSRFFGRIRSFKFSLDDVEKKVSPSVPSSSNLLTLQTLFHRHCSKVQTCENQSIAEGSNRILVTSVQNAAWQLQDRTVDEVFDSIVWTFILKNFALSVFSSFKRFIKVCRLRCIIWNSSEISSGNFKFSAPTPEFGLSLPDCRLFTEDYKTVEIFPGSMLIYFKISINYKMQYLVKQK